MYLEHKLILEMMKDKNYVNAKWKPVWFKNIDENEKYEVSNFGQIRRFKKNINDWALLKNQLVNGYRYFTFKLNEKGKKKAMLVHKIVAMAFCEKPSENHQFVIHLDFEKENNEASNLKWSTRADVTAHHKNNPNYNLGQNKSRRLTNAKLTETDVIKLKKMIKEGKTRLSKIAREFGITHTQLNRIKSGENWGYVKIDED